MENIFLSFKNKWENFDNQRNLLNEKIHKKQQKIDKLLKGVQKLNEKKENLNYPNWIDDLVKPLAEELKIKLNAYCYEIFGPFGLRSETSIYLYTREPKNHEESYHVPFYTISLLPRDLKNGVLYYDTGEEKGGYEENSIGYLGSFYDKKAGKPIISMMG